MSEQREVGAAMWGGRPARTSRQLAREVREARTDPETPARTVTLRDAAALGVLAASAALLEVGAWKAADWAGFLLTGALLAVIGVALGWGEQ